MAHAKHKNDLLAKAADNLGELRAEMDALKKDAKYWEDVLKNSGTNVVEGDLFRVTISRSTRTTVNWKGIAEKLKASDYMKKAYSKVSEVVTLKVSAHKK